MGSKGNKKAKQNNVENIGSKEQFNLDVTNNIEENLQKPKKKKASHKNAVEQDENVETLPEITSKKSKKIKPDMNDLEIEAEDEAFIKKRKTKKPKKVAMVAQDNTDNVKNNFDDDQCILANVNNNIGVQIQIPEIDTEDDDNILPLVQERYNMKNNDATETLPNWPDTDLKELVHRMEKCIPEKDALAYSTRAEKLNWDQIAFNNYSGEDCKRNWNLLQKHIRRFRLLSEVLSDAKDWLSAPRSPKKKRHPDMPRRPLSAYMIFYMKKKDKVMKETPNCLVADIAKRVAFLYKTLPPEKKEKYEKIAAAQKAEYELKLEQFYQIHPDLRPQKPERPPKPEKPPKSPKVERPPKPEKSPKPVKEKKIIEAKPKKPTTPFQYYFHEEVKKLQKSTSEPINKTAIKIQCKEKWKNFNSAEKMYWINYAEKAAKEYEQNVQMYLINHPDFVPQPVKQILSKEEQHLKEKIAGKPDRPPCSAYGCFSKQYLLSEQIKLIKPNERMLHMAESWRDLSEDEKKHYVDMHNKLTEQYKKEFEAYLQTLPEDKRQEEIEKSATKRKLPSNNNSPTKRGPPNKKKRKERSKPKESSKPPVSNKKYSEPEQPPITAKKYFTKMYEGPENPSAAWKSLSDEEKQHYEAELTKKKKEYIVAFEKFLKSLTKEELQDYSFSRKQNIANDDEEDEEEEDDESSNSSSEEGSEQESEDDEDNDDEDN